MRAKTILLKRLEGADDRLLKDIVEKQINAYARNHPNVTITIGKISTGVYKNGVFQMYIYYRKNAIRIEIKEGTPQYEQYDLLMAERLAYQKASANPYSTKGKLSFFVDVADISEVLIRMLDCSG